MSDSGRRLVVCLVGTDHHRFDRIVGWCDSLAQTRQQVEVLVQYGASSPPRAANGTSYLSKSELIDTLSRAHCAVTHGGPGLISEIRAAGLLPIAVPRDPKLGEHVDGHQQRFVAKTAVAGHVLSVDSEDELIAAVDEQLAEPRGAGIDPREDAERVQRSARRFSELVNQVLKQQV